MPPNKLDWKQLSKDLEEKRGTELQRSVLLLKSAAVSAERLTQSPTWNAYLQQLHALLLESRNGMEAAKNELPSACTVEAICRQQMTYWFQAGLHFAYGKAMELPKAIIAAHKGSGIEEPIEELPPAAR